MKHIITALALVANMSASAQTPPSDFVLIAQNKSGFKVYINPRSVTKTYFIDGSPGRLAQASLWDKHGFYKRVANCETYALAHVVVDRYGNEASQDWEASIDGTLAYNIAETMCVFAYIEQKGKTL
jgi:hypothetical protein